MYEILLIVNVLSNQLQEKNSTLGKASNLIKTVIKTLEDKRNEIEFKIIWKEVQEFSKKNNVSLLVPSFNSKGKSYYNIIIVYIVEII